MNQLYNAIKTIFRYLDRHRVYLFIVFFILWGSVTLSYWKKYDWNPTSMVNFGREFALQNKSETPTKAIFFLGEEGDLGAGYDGQIFYYFSRSLSNFSLIWPIGFDESYRAPRIGYPFLIAIPGILGPYGTIVGMYFFNLSLMVISFLALRSLLSPESRYLSVLYLLNPFSLGSYYVLVSDSVMVSLVILAYYLFLKEKYFYFLLTSSLAILTKEPALFFLFPLGVKVLFKREHKKILLVATTLLIPFLWHAYLSYRFPNWRATRLTDFILPLEGMISYFESIFFSLEEAVGFKELARLLSRFPLVLLFFICSFLIFTGNIRKGWEFRLGLLLTMLMVGTAGYYHFWSVYENVSRMFTISIPLFILLVNNDEKVSKQEFVILTMGLLFLFLVKIFFVSRILNFQMGM